MKLLSFMFGAMAFLLLLLQSIKVMAGTEAFSSADTLVLASTCSFLSTLFIGLRVATKG